MPVQDIQRALKQIQSQEKAYCNYTNYYDGKHKLNFASENFDSTFGETFRDFAYNLCPTVVDAVVEKLEIKGFSVREGKGEERDELLAKEIWEENRMDQRASEAHQEAVTTGDSYLFVWPDKEGRPVITPNEAATMTVFYDPETQKISMAAKAWKVDVAGADPGSRSQKRTRVNLYYPTHIEKYISSGAQSGKYEQWKTEGETWPLKNPYGQVPVFHLSNNPRLGKKSGRSELAPVLKLQDALNKSVVDMLVAMEFASFPQRWATGIQPDYDEETGEERVSFKSGIDRLWQVADELAKFGEFSPADLEKFIAVTDSILGGVGRVSATPIHYLMLQQGEFPSGESLKTAESRFTAKMNRRQTVFGNVWEDLMAFALLISERKGVSFSTQWRDPAPRSEKEYAATLLVHQQLVVPLLEKVGYTADEAKAIAKAAADLGAVAMDKFTNGPSTTSPGSASSGADGEVPTQRQAMTPGGDV